LASGKRSHRRLILPRLSASPPYDWGRWAGAVRAMAASTNCDGPERVISSGFCSCISVASRTTSISIAKILDEKVQKQTHSEATPRSVLSVARRTSNATSSRCLKS
jgi:hypothetical protein